MNILLNRNKSILQSFFNNIMKYAILLLFVVTLLVVLIPFNPTMPSNNLDSSWAFSLNQAVGQKLDFGKNVLFNFGPYASIYTEQYHPATDLLMMLGSIFLGLCYSATLIYLFKGKGNYIVISTIFIWSCLIYSRDSLLFSYPLIIAITISNYIPEKNNKINYKYLLFFSIIYAPLGLLPLIKGTLLILSFLTIIAISIYLLYHRFYKLILITLISPMISIVLFWLLSGQSFVYLPYYFTSMSQMILGYTEAMAVKGNNKEVFVYIIAVIVVIISLFKIQYYTIPTKILISIVSFIFLFVSFKEGFVRHDGHATVAATSLLIATMLLFLISSPRKFIIAIFITTIAWAYIDKNYIDTSTKQLFEKLRYTYSDALNGFLLRVSKKDYFKNKYEQALLAINQDYYIPKLHGTTDIYSYDQAQLLASENIWNPRPVFQSYQSCTPKLEKINEEHIRDGNAPDNILFRVQPIDGRLPSIEDGLSWPAIFDNYSIFKYDKGLLYLEKKQILKKSSYFSTLYKKECKLGENILLPNIDSPLFAKINIKSTLLGRILNFLYKPPQLKIIIYLTNGAKKEYRVISKMLSSGFFISPLVESTEGFYLLMKNNKGYIEKYAVKSFKIEPVYGISIFWNLNYLFKLEYYQMPLNKKNEEKIIQYFNVHNNGQPALCSIDTIGTSSPVPAGSNIEINPKDEKYVRVTGWAVDNINKVPALAVLAEIDGKPVGELNYGLERGDVANTLGNKNYTSTGFDDYIDVEKLSMGKHVIRLRVIENGAKGFSYSPDYYITISSGSANNSDGVDYLFN